MKDETKKEIAVKFKLGQSARKKIVVVQMIGTGIDIDKPEDSAFMDALLKTVAVCMVEHAQGMPIGSTKITQTITPCIGQQIASTNCF